MNGWKKEFIGHNRSAPTAPRRESTWLTLFWMAVTMGPSMSPASALAWASEPTAQTSALLHTPDWVEERGARDPSRVRFMGEFQVQRDHCHTYGGCADEQVSITVLVHPEEKEGSVVRAGIVWQDGLVPEHQTAYGTFQEQLPQGWQKHRVLLTRRGSDPNVLVLNAFAEGPNGLVYDDNGGARHVIALFSDKAVVYQTGSSLRLDEHGVRGQLEAHLLDLCPEKDLRLIWSVDGWRSSAQLPAGNPGDKNAWTFVEGFAWSRQVWRMDVDLAVRPEPGQSFQYQILYAHTCGGRGDGKQFLDDNGGRAFTVKNPAAAAGS